MKDLIKKLGVALYERVWKSWKSTVVGLGFFALAVSLETIQTVLTGNEATWARVALSVVGLALVFVRGKVSQPVPPADPVP